MSHTKQSIMDQAQVYASAWSMVGGPFDRGQALENAEEMSRELSTMIEAVFQQRDELLVALEKAAEVFDFYAKHHASKTIPEEDKARNNYEHRNMCRSAIATAKGGA